MKTTTLPDDILLFQLLPRLPVRSLGRCKCVCKQWRSLLTTPEFTKMHLHQVNNQNHPKQLLVSTSKPCKYFRTMDCETPLVALSSTRSLPFKANSNELSIIASLDGLVCVGINLLPRSLGRYSDILLWNPLTGDYKTLSKDNCHVDGSTLPVLGYGLYHSACDDDYKLVCVTLSNDAFIYSLKSDSWRKIESTTFCPSTYWTSSCLLNENLYFLAQGRHKMDLWRYPIIRFDTKTEKFTEIAAPSLEYLPTRCVRLTVVSGCLHMCMTSVGTWSPGKLEMWKMDGDGEWTEVVSCCHTLIKHVAYQPLHLMKNGNWLVSRGVVNCAYEVDLETKTTKKVCSYTPTPTDSPMNTISGGKFVETMVSLNRIQDFYPVRSYER